MTAGTGIISTGSIISTGIITTGGTRNWSNPSFFNFDEFASWASLMSIKMAGKRGARCGRLPWHFLIVSASLPPGASCGATIAISAPIASPRWSSPTSDIRAGVRRCSKNGEQRKASHRSSDCLKSEWTRTDGPDWAPAKSGNALSIRHRSSS